VVCDRYVPSNLAFQAAKLPYQQRQHLIDFIEQGAYAEIGLPRPDIVLYLDVPFVVSANLIVEKDQHERDGRYQEIVREIYKTLAKRNSAWHIVDCVENNSMLSPAAVHGRVMEILNESVF
jgi:dTMP kinase